MSVSRRLHEDAVVIDSVVNGTLAPTSASECARSYADADSAFRVRPRPCDICGSGVRVRVHVLPVDGVVSVLALCWSCATVEGGGR